MKVTTLPNFHFRFETDFGTFNLRPTIYTSYHTEYNEKTGKREQVASEKWVVSIGDVSVTFNGKTYTRLGSFDKQGVNGTFYYSKGSVCNEGEMTEKATQKFTEWFRTHAVPYFESINFWVLYRNWERVYDRNREFEKIESLKKELAKLQEEYDQNKQGVTPADELEAHKNYNRGDWGV